MKIVLMRHGRPLVHLESMRHERKSPAETGAVIRDYEFTDLDRQQIVPHRSLDIAHACTVTFSSDMQRAVSSTDMLGLKNIVTRDACFRESDHPYLTWQKPKLKFFTWCIIFRLAWFLGFAQNGESIKVGRERAQISADKLQQAAQKDGTVMLLAHGIINRLIAAKLKQKGWRIIETTGHDYWSYIVLERD